MWSSVLNDWRAIVALLIFLLLTLWFFISPQTASQRYFGDFASFYFVLALWGGFWGIVISKDWGFTNSVIGKAILMFSLGLFAQIFGQLVYAYFSFYQHIEIPYPSLGDLGYFGSIPLYVYGVTLLAKASGVKIRTQPLASKLRAVSIPLVVLLVSYFLFLQGYEFDWSNPLKIFLDFGYPFGQAIYLSLAILTYVLSKGMLGGIMKNKVLFILFALGLQYIADFNFLFQTIQGTWAAGGYGDYLYLVAYFVMTLALLELNSAMNKLKH